MVGKALAPVIIGRYPALRNLEEARQLIQEVEAGPGNAVTKLASRYLAVTAARSEAVRYAEWGEIEWGRKQWRVPGDHMKGQKQPVQCFAVRGQPRIARARHVLPPATQLSGYSAGDTWPSADSQLEL